MKCTDLSIIKYLAENLDKEVFQKDIEHFFSLTAPSVSNKLRTLQKKGLIERVYSTVDTRLKQVILTEKAIEVDVKMRAEMETFENLLDGLIEEDEKETFMRIIDKLKKEFD